MKLRGRLELQLTEEMGDWHSMNVAGIAGFRGMGVEMGVDPNESERAEIAKGARHTTPGSDRTTASFQAIETTILISTEGNIKLTV